MSGLIVPGGAAKPEPTAPSYDSLTEEQKAAVDALAAKEKPEDHFEPVETAFVVVKNTDGSYGISNDLNPKIAPKRSADENDYLSAFAVIEQNLNAQMTALMVQQAMMQHAAAMQQQMQAQQIQSRLKL